MLRSVEIALLILNEGINAQHAGDMSYGMSVDVYHVRGIVSDGQRR